jgi:hypothetical protein
MRPAWIAIGAFCWGLAGGTYVTKKWAPPCPPRDGTCEVTTKNADGPGSLRDCVTRPRRVVFEVDGHVETVAPLPEDIEVDQTFTVREIRMVATRPERGTYRIRPAGEATESVYPVWDCLLYSRGQPGTLDQELRCLMPGGTGGYGFTPEVEP